MPTRCSDLCSELPAQGMTFGLRRECRTAFRKRSYFIVITVTIVTLPMSMGFLRDALNGCDRHFVVTSTVTARSLYLGGFTPCCDGDDARDGLLRAFSNCACPASVTLRYVRNPTNPTS
jgi:hypothetical protein